MALPKPKTKAKFFELEGKRWEKLDALAADLPEAAWTQPGAAGEWSLKDVWAHLAAWMKETRRVLPMLLRGESVTAHIQEFNREHAARDCSLSFDAALRRVERERKQLLKALASIPEDDLLGNRRLYSWASYSTYNHYAEHIPSITRFRRATLRRVQRAARKK